ncbi:MAG: cation transport protein ChaC [Halocynthiibacter sp.]|jgi:cation transport protein ChaC
MTDQLWVFGYGSLMWNPGFEYAAREVARLSDYARSFCMWSIHHRGTVDDPGLVLALDQENGAACDGYAFALHVDQQDDVLAYLRERELISSAYLERRLAIDLRSGARVEAITYVIDPVHEQYCGGLELERQAQIIAGATGGRGPNKEYLWNTEKHLREMGLEDKDLRWLANRVREITAS